MRHAVSLELHAYWHALRAGRSAPDAGDIDPAAIARVLPFTFVLDAAAVGGALLRLSGTRLDALFGRDLRGSPFLDLWAPASVGGAGRALAAALAGPVPVWAAARGAPPGRAPSAFEMLLLPLRGRRRLLGSLAAARMPGWAGLLSIGRLDFDGFRVLGGVEPGPAAPRPSAVPRPPVRVGHLRVYAGGRETEDDRAPMLTPGSARFNGSGPWWRAT